MTRRRNLWNNEEGYAVAEATILFPIILMTFAGLVLLSMYLPARAVLQRQTQIAATALATTQSDTWLEFDDRRLEYYWLNGNHTPVNVYAALLSSFFKGDAQSRAEDVVRKLDEGSLVESVGDLTIECKINNYVIYKEIVVTATRKIPSPVDLSILKFPEEIEITVSSTAVVQNGDEFVRNIDLAAEFVDYIKDKYNLDFSALSEWLDKAWKFLGI